MVQFRTKTFFINLKSVCDILEKYYSIIIQQCCPNITSVMF